LRHRCGGVAMDLDFDDYLRDEAAKYRKLAEQTVNELLKKELCELAEICEEVANKFEDRMTAG
jgi:hypothetical protein